MDGEPKGLHVENPLGRRAPQLSCDCVAAFNHCQRGAFWRVPFHIFGKQRGEFVPGVSGDECQIVELDNGKLLFDNNLADLNYGNGGGEWLGYRKTDASFMVYFNKTFTAENVYLNMLQNIGGYIFPPASVEVWGGTEKDKLKLLGKITPEMPKKENKDDATKLVQEKISFVPSQIKYMKIVAKPLQKLPAWHGGKGEPAWIFLSEVVVN